MTVTDRCTRKRVSATTCAVASLLVISPATYASDLSVYGTLTTEYIYRGLSISDHNPAVQGGIDYRHDSQLFAGAWITTIDLRNANGSRELEANFYAGYRHDFSPDWAATATVLRYAYPGATGNHSYDHNEVLIEVSWGENYAIEYAFTDDVYGLGQDAKSLQFSAAWPMGSGWLLGANLGRNDLSSRGVPEYWYGDVGLSLTGSRFVLDIRVYDNESSGTTRFESSQAGARLVLSVSAAL